MNRSRLLCKLAKNNEVVEISDVSHRIEVENQAVANNLQTDLDIQATIEVESIFASESGRPTSSDLSSTCANNVAYHQTGFASTNPESNFDDRPRPSTAILDGEKCEVSLHTTSNNPKPNFEVRPGTSGENNVIESRPKRKIEHTSKSDYLDFDSDSNSSLGFGYDSDKDREYFPDSSDERQSNIVKRQHRIRSDLSLVENDNRPNANANLMLNDANDNEADPLNLHEQSPSKRSRWRTARPDKWKINVNKRKRKSGLPYKSKKGKEMAAKSPKPVHCDNCIYKCNNKFTEEERVQICKEYTASSYERQKDFLLTRVKQNDVERKRRRPGNDQERPEKHFSYVYTFLKDNRETRVCKSFFLSTLCISNGPLKTAFANKSDVSGTFAGNDKRGHKAPPNKTSDLWVLKIKAHIESFVAMESHYCRKDTHKLYLDPTLSIRKMYELFQESHKNESNLPSEGVYRNIFCTQYNMDFFTPSNDKCLVCKRYETAKGQEKDLLEKDYKAHIKRKEEANASKAEDKKRANNDSTFVSATFDLQKVLQIPVSDAGPVYYSRKLCVYNLTVYEAALPNKAYCFAWNECNAKRGSCEIGSCILQWFQTLPSSVKEVSLFSDTCGGQNRNQYMAALFLYIVQTYSVNIVEHKFLESGHTKMEVDSMHAAIEYAQQNISIYSMSQWLTVFAMARSNRNRNKKKEKKPIKAGYLVKELLFNDFVDLKDLAAKLIENRTKDSTGKTVQWLKIKRLCFQKSRPNVIFFSYQSQGEYSELVAYQKCPGRPQTINLKKLYSSELPISEAKKKDLLKLCRSGVIPKEYHQWFSSKKSSKVNMPDETPEPTLEEYFSSDEEDS